MSKKRILIVLPEKGDLYMEIKAPDGMSLYRGNGKENTEFTVTSGKASSDIHEAEDFVEFELGNLETQ